MRDPEGAETKPAEPRNESQPKPEPKQRPKQHDEKRRTQDTLSEENPCICRGID